MNYNRVIPRDLFNEAKLLKCLGQLSLLIHEGRGIDPAWQLVLSHDHEDNGFPIYRNTDDGSIFCSNVLLTAGGADVRLYSPLNSKRPYPLHFFGQRRSGDNYPTVDGEVFNDDGTLSSEFQSFLAP